MSEASNKSVRSMALVAALAGFAMWDTVRAGAAAAGRAEIPDPLALYGDQILFDVFRNEDMVGRHQVRFEASGRDLTVSSSLDLQVDFLLVTVFRYAYRSEESWQDGELRRLSATVDDNGEPFALDAVGDGDRLTVRTGQASVGVVAPVFPTNHWHAGVLTQTRVLNTLTGKVNAVRIRPSGREVVATERGDVSAMRYVYSGELETEVWYDDAGRWVKMRFAGRDGSMIDYRCRRCQGGIARRAEK